MSAAAPEMSVSDKIEYFSNLFVRRLADTNVRFDDKIKNLKGVAVNLGQLAQEIDPAESKLRTKYEEHVVQAMRTLPLKKDFREIRDDLIEILTPGFKETKAQLDAARPFIELSNVQILQNAVDAFNRAVESEYYTPAEKVAVTIKAVEELQTHADRIYDNRELHTAYMRALDKCATKIADDRTYVAANIAIGGMNLKAA